MSYEVLANVKIIRFVPTEEIGYGIFGTIFRKIEKPNENWAVIYNVSLKSWIVTNELLIHGLNAAAEDLQMIGFGENLNAALFIVWEHQTSLCLDWTILDEIKKLHREQVFKPDMSEWKWNK
ncbi:hypothetical protein [Paenibacillus sp. NRS-1760]|uniref:hypothetical protein n=1 Tax=Paenibacillus sp. NRS-1760 TaxID=3233902 RepID=UPI003D2D4851